MPYDAIYFVTVSMVVLTGMIVSWPLTKFLHLPRGLILMAIGLAGSEWMALRDIDIGIHEQDFHELVVYLFLPALIFQASLRIDIGKLIENIAPVFTLSVPMLLIAGAIASAMMYFTINDSGTFPWIAALLAGALIMPIDSTATATVRERLRLPMRTGILIEGESLLNSATALVVFAFVLGIALGTTSVTSTGSFYTAVAFDLSLMFFGGSALGVLAAIPACMLLDRLRDTGTQIAVTLVCAYGTFMLAGFKVTGVSGIMAVLACGIVISANIYGKSPEERSPHLAETWSFIGNGLESAIYLLAGISLSIASLGEHWPAMLIGIAAAVISRIIAVYGSFPLFNATAYKTDPAGSGEQHAVALGGTRGAITIALALSLPPELAYGTTLQAIAYGVVIFTLLTQTGALAILARRLPRPSGRPETSPD